MFEKATRQKLRFESVKGLMSVEDLWDLPLESSAGKPNLNDVARSVYRDLKAEDQISFVAVQQKTDEVTQLKMDIVKHIIQVKLSEADAAKQLRDAKEKKQKIMEIMSRKQDAALESASLDDLKAMYDAMN
jgi:hypothetical protein